MSKRLRGLGWLAVTPAVALIVGCGSGEGSAADAAQQGQADASPPDARTTDARPAQLGCITSPPSPGPQISVSGVTKNILDDESVPDVTLQAFRTSDDGLEVTETSASDGVFDLRIATGGSAWNGYIVGSASDHADTYVYLPDLREDFMDVDLPVLTETQLRVVSALAGVSLDESKGLIVVYALDCDKEGVESARISFSPQPEVRAYLNGENPDTQATSTDISGSAFALNAPAGDVDITVEFAGETFQRTVKSVAGALTIAVVFP